MFRKEAFYHEDKFGRIVACHGIMSCDKGQHFGSIDEARMVLGRTESIDLSLI